MNRDKCKRALFLCVKYLVSAAVVAVVVGPLLVTLFTSVKTQDVYKRQVSPVATTNSATRSQSSSSSGSLAITSCGTATLSPLFSTRRYAIVWFLPFKNR